VLGVLLVHKVLVICLAISSDVDTRPYGVFWLWAIYTFTVWVYSEAVAVGGFGIATRLQKDLQLQLDSGVYQYKNYQPP
jgi:hypothetical protein